MFASLIKTLFKGTSDNISGSSNHDEPQNNTKVINLKQDVENMLSEVNEIDCLNRSSSKESIADSFELISFANKMSEDLNDNSLDESKSEINFDEETIQDPVEDKIQKNDIVKKINSLQCIFTWKLKSNERNIISQILNEYGDYNLDISSPEFSLKRFIGNLIIGYELFHNGEIENGQIKILEIGKWLEELDNGSDKFYLSINTGLYHIMKGTFIHMLYASNLLEECKWLLDDIIPFNKMNCIPKASIFAIHAAVLTEYGANAQYYKKACYFANKACVLDPSSPHWFYIYAVALTKQRTFLHSYKSHPTENEINSIQHAIILSDGKDTVFNYHRILLDKDSIIRNFHDNINIKNKNMYDINLKANQKIVEMIKTVISMEPKDPLVIVGCAKILMTLPIKVRDFDLGKMYLTKAMQMAPNDVAVLNSIEKAITHYKRVDHFSSFGSKKFNLADLICNEIRLATNSCETPSEEMLFYFKALTKIMETFRLEMKDVDPSMKSKLIVNSSDRLTCLSAAFKSGLNLSDNNSEVGQNKNITNKSNKPKSFQNVGPKIFKAKSRGNKKNNLNTSNAKKFNFQTSFPGQSHQSNIDICTDDINQMKSKMSKFLKSSEEVEFSNHVSLGIKNLGALQTQEKIKRYSQMLYQHVSNDKPLQNTSSVDSNTYPHQNSNNSNHMFQSSLPSLLNIRPQIDPRFLPSTSRHHINRKK
ncbi:uncharacterized protein LOC112691465 isoform X2 [Sipha flava]|uniref:Uncharacterized protein LOC112691465 isoform X2 n=1 Tax=Sipha flava TaxID=143950 RepID=A0A8B8GFY4_9HEMI|nr:uncharacterized protein LOC112691465 isoform X2 [Sipha flava]